MKRSYFLTNIVWYSVAFCTIAAAIVCAYYPSLSYEFQFDDLANINRYFNIRHHTFWDLFFSGTRWISYWLNAFFYKISGFEPYSYRIGSVIIHTINAFLVFFLFEKILKHTSAQFKFFKCNRHILALLTALLFGIHPVQTQTVSYVIQSQLEGLATMMVLMISILFMLIVSVQNIFKRSLFFVTLCIVAALSTGTKEIAIISPILIMLIDYFFVAHGSWKIMLNHKGIYATVTVIVIGIYLWLLKPSFFIKALVLQMEAKNNIGNIITQLPQQCITPLHYALSEFKVIIHYIQIFLWPHGISVEYDWKLVDSFFSPDCVIPFMLLCALIGGIAYLLWSRGTHPIAFGMLWFLIVLAPRSTIIPSPELIVDYKTYMGSPGILFVIASGILYGALCLAKLFSVTKIWIPAYISVLSILCICIPLTRMRNTVWSSGIEFWANIIVNSPGKARAYNNYGVELAQKLSRFEDAIPYYQKAIAMDRYYSDPWNNLAVSYAALNKINDAIYATTQGLNIYPYYPEGYNNLASFYLQEKKYDQAKEALNIALRLRPHYGKALYNLGRLYLDQGDQEQAWIYFKKCCCNGDLDNEIGFEAYAQMSLLCKKYDEAYYGYQKLLSLQPKNKEYHFGLATVYQYKNQYHDAERIYRKLIEENPNEGRFWYNFAECLFCKKEYQEALPIFQKIIQSGKCPAQAMIRLAGCHEGLGKNNIAYKILEELKKSLSDNEKKLVEEAQQRMCLAYGDSIKE